MTSLGDEQPDNLLFYPAPISNVLLSQAGIGYLLSTPSILPFVVAETIGDVNLFYMNKTSPYAAPGQATNEYAEANGYVEPGAPLRAADVVVQRHSDHLSQRQQRMHDSRRDNQ